MCKAHTHFKFYLDNQITPCWLINLLWLKYALYVFQKLLVWHFFSMESITHRILTSLLYPDVNIKMTEHKHLKSKLFDAWTCVFTRDRKTLPDFNSHSFHLNVIPTETHVLIHCTSGYLKEMKILYLMKHCFFLLNYLLLYMYINWLISTAHCPSEYNDANIFGESSNDIDVFTFLV